MSDIEPRVREYGWQAGAAGRLLFVVGILFSVFQIVTASYSPLSSSIVRAVHVGFLLLLGYGLFRGRADQPLRSTISWLFGITGFVLAFYHWVFEEDLILRAGDPSDMDLIVGGITLVLVFEAARRVIGIALPVICGLFLAYALFGEHLPGDLAHRGYALSAFGGLEIACMAGAHIGAASAGGMVLVDGFIATAAALCAPLRPFTQTRARDWKPA